MSSLETSKPKNSEMLSTLLIPKELDLISKLESNLSKEEVLLSRKGP